MRAHFTGRRESIRASDGDGDVCSRDRLSKINPWSTQLVGNTQTLSSINIFQKKDLLDTGANLLGSFRKSSFPSFDQRVKTLFRKDNQRRIPSCGSVTWDGPSIGLRVNIHRGTQGMLWTAGFSLSLTMTPYEWKQDTRLREGLQAQSRWRIRSGAHWQSLEAGSSGKTVSTGP